VSRSSGNRRRPLLRAVAFDLDGTLIDSFADLTAAVNGVREHYRLPPISQNEVRRHVGQGAPELVRRAVPVPPVEQGAAHARFLDFYDRNLLHSTRPYPGVEAVLQGLTGLPLGVITNKPIAQTEAILRGLGWTGRFAVVLGGDSLSAKKPDPLPVIEFLRRTGVKAGETIMVGDSPADICAGQAAGTLTAAVVYGNTARDDLAALNPAFLLDDLAELLDFPR